MDSLEEIISNTCHAYPGGIKSLAADISVNPGTLYNKCNPSMASHHLTIQEALDVMHHSQDFSILEILSLKTHHACISSMQFKHVSDMVLFDAWTACDIEHGITAKIIRDALEDKCINKTEFQQIHSEMFIDFARELELLDRLRQFSGLTDYSTKEKPTLAETIHETVQTALVEFPEIASNISIREIELHKKSDPYNPEDIFTVQETLKLMQKTKNYSILYTIAAQLNNTCIAIPHYNGVDDMELLDAWSNWSDERGDTVSVIHITLMDSTIEHNELMQIEKEMFQDFHTELALLARLKSLIK